MIPEHSQRGSRREVGLHRLRQASVDWWQVEFKYVDDLATVWCEWAEMELRHKNFKRALDLMRRATYTPDVGNRRAVSARAFCDAHAGILNLAGVRAH